MASSDALGPRNQMEEPAEWGRGKDRSENWFKMQVPNVPECDMAGPGGSTSNQHPRGS